MSGCTHGMPTPASCIECMDEGLLPPPRRLSAPEIQCTFTARYPGRCARCDRGFSEGDQIGYTVDETYVHERCGQ